MKYNEIFNKLIMKILDIGEKDALDKYKRGLCIDLQFEVARSKPKSVDEAQAVALECDQIAYEIKSQSSKQQREYYNAAGPRNNVNNNRSVSRVTNNSSGINHHFNNNQHHERPGSRVQFQVRREFASV